MPLLMRKDFDTVSQLYDEIDRRAIMLGEYICTKAATVRCAAEKFGISKSTVHKDVTHRLKEISPALAKDVRTVLEKNKAERHLRGGQATKEKYLTIKKHNSEF